MGVKLIIMYLIIKYLIIVGVKYIARLASTYFWRLVSAVEDLSFASEPSYYTNFSFCKYEYAIVYIFILLIFET